MTYVDRRFAARRASGTNAPDAGRVNSPANRLHHGVAVTNTHKHSRARRPSWRCGMCTIQPSARKAAVELCNCRCLRVRTSVTRSSYQTSGGNQRLCSTRSSRRVPAAVARRLPLRGRRPWARSVGVWPAGLGARARRGTTELTQARPNMNDRTARIRYAGRRETDARGGFADRERMTGCACCTITARCHVMSL